MIERILQQANTVCGLHFVLLHSKPTRSTITVFKEIKPSGSHWWPLELSLSLLLSRFLGKHFSRHFKLIELERRNTNDDAQCNKVAPSVL